MSLLREQIVKRFTRSSKWPALSKKAKRYYKKCAACGTKKRLETHHILPVAKYPALELVWKNLIVLCFL